MGFFTRILVAPAMLGIAMSQSLSGWDGVFHYFVEPLWIITYNKSQSLSGWDGVFHPTGQKS